MDPSISTALQGQFLYIPVLASLIQAMSPSLLKPWYKTCVVRFDFSGDAFKLEEADVADFGPGGSVMRHGDEVVGRLMIKIVELT
ncbi:hypothetical protein E2C01_051150 [Portunus trituberculatus]|uniref:Uncharacterized protein n=1 Tax=Portunus trituberculatus TaxID=210409 RepID=A0A5B7GID7_PORTR|nr:hypothetical protein [Portunus trituberculatus]